MGMDAGCADLTRPLGEGHTSAGSGWVRLYRLPSYTQVSDVLLTWHCIAFLTWSFKTKKAGFAVQLVECLPSKKKVLGSISSIA